MKIELHSSTQKMWAAADQIIIFLLQLVEKDQILSELTVGSDSEWLRKQNSIRRSFSTIRYNSGTEASIQMQNYLATLAFILFGMVLARAIPMRKQGKSTRRFDNLDKTDFLIQPLALIYFYTVFTAAFNRPTVSKQDIFDSEINSWLGVHHCLVTSAAKQASAGQSEMTAGPLE